MTEDNNMPEIGPKDELIDAIAELDDEGDDESGEDHQKERGSVCSKEPLDYILVATVTNTS